MAFDFSKLNIFSKLGARGRIAVLASGVVVTIGVMYFAIEYFAGGSASTGESRVASVGNVESIPGGDLTPEYNRALDQANAKAAEQAKISGGSAIPTLVRTASAPQTVTGTDQCIICSDEQTNVKPALDEMVRKGELSPDLSALLQQLADKSISIDDFAAELAKLVRQGKLTPEQARKLLDLYKSQFANDQLKESAAVMDDMIKSGQVPLDVATELLAAQKGGMSPAEYAALLDRLVREGKLSKAAAQMLLAQYTQQQAKNVIAKSVASLKEMARKGELIPEVEKALIDLENRMVPVQVYSSTLDKYVASGKLIPLISNKILAEYKAQKAMIGPTGSVNKMLQQAEAEAYGEINDLLKEGRMSQDVAVKLTDLIQKDIPFNDYRNVILQLEKEGKIPPDIAKLKIADYRAVKGLRIMAQSLSTLQGNNAGEAAYAAELQRGVKAGELTPAQAEQLLDEYRALRGATSPTSTPTTTGGGDFARLQQRLQQANQTTQPDTTFEAPKVVPEDPTTPQLTAEEIARRQQLEDQLAQERNAALEAAINAMSGQASQLVAAWQPTNMQHKKGTPDTPKDDQAGAAGTGTAAATDADKAKTDGTTTPAGPTLVKAGSVLFAVLDTAVNSDYPDSPVMATIVDGKWKGSKVLGKLQVTKGVSGQLDRVMLNFTIMNNKEWDKSKTVTAFAIDPDTARTVLASHVDYHYLQRFGAIMATSFLQGYASAITQAGTSTTGIFGTSTTHPELSPTEKLATALGQMGQTLGEATKNYTNIPPTVKVHAGVGLGILFMSDLT